MTASTVDPTIILEHEARYADEHYRPYRHDLLMNPNMFRKYADPKHPWDWREVSAQLLGNVAGKSLLDYGCGMGEESVYFAKLGARVTAIDISPLGIEIARERALMNGVSDQITSIIMKGNPTDFPSNSFDVVHGLGILHHVGLVPAMQEIKRILKPGGIGVFLEPIGNCPAVEAVKGWMVRTWPNRFTPGTDYERELTMAEMLEQRKEFSQFESHPFHLTWRARKLFPAPLHGALLRVDHLLLKVIPPLRYFAGAVVVRVQK